MTEEHSPKTWQQLGDEFYSMLGTCITEWANVDNELFRIFQKCVGPYEQCAIIYYRTPGLDTRLSLTDEIVMSVLPSRERKSGGHDHSDVKAWKVAKNGFREELAVRRRLAHHPVQIRTGQAARYGALMGRARFGSTRLGEAPSPPPSWFEIYEGQHESKRGQGSPKPPLKLEDLQRHLIEVVHLRDRLYSFYYEVLARGDGRGLSANEEEAK